MTEGLTLVLRNRLEDVGAMTQAVEAFLAAQGLDPGPAAQVALALDELATNAISYGFEPGVEVEAAVHVTLGLNGWPDGPGGARAVWAVIEDRGRPFDPLSVPEPDTTAGLEARSIGGLGVHLVRQVMDEIAYERADGRNRIGLCKRL
jgi:anti-sigma regulatory factor (Ser/Thr protein kinase)